MKIGCTKTVVFSSVLVLRFSLFRFDFKKFSMIQLSDRHCIDNTCITNSTFQCAIEICENFDNSEKVLDCEI